MKRVAMTLLMSVVAGLASAQTRPNPAPDTGPQTNPVPNAASVDDQLLLMKQQLDAINALIVQNQRGLVVYPSSFALPGPINCQSSCEATVTSICSTLRYPKVYFYPALVTSQVVGTFVNGVCYGP